MYVWQGVRVYVCFKHFHTALKTLPLAAPWSKIKERSGTSPSLGFLSDGPLLEWLVYFRQMVLETSWCQIASCIEKSVGWMNLFLGVQKVACRLFLFAQKRPLM